MLKNINNGPVIAMDIEKKPDNSKPYIWFM